MTTKLKTKEQPTNLYDVLRDEHEHGPLALVLWYTMLDCYTHIERRIRHRMLQEFGTHPSSYDVLTALQRHPDGMTMGKLADLLMVTNGNVTGIVQRLETSKLVSKKVLKSDKRTRTVKLTAEGLRHWRLIHGEYQSLIETLFAEVKQSDSRSLIRDLRQLQQCVSKR